MGPQLSDKQPTPRELDKHFVVAGYIVHSGKLLLVAHKKLGKWLPPGGHIDGKETPEEALRREIAEETGLQVEIIADRDTNSDDESTRSLLRPQHMQVEDIDESHQHIDLIYFCRAVDDTIYLEGKKLAAARWFSPKELRPDKQIITDDGLVLPKHVSYLGLCAITALQE